MQLIPITGLSSGVFVRFTKDSSFLLAVFNDELSVSIVAYDRRISDIPFGRKIWKEFLKEFLKDNLTTANTLSAMIVARRFKKWLRTEYGRKYE